MENNITEQTYSIEDLDKIAEENSVFVLDCDVVPKGTFILGVIQKIVPTKTEFGVRLDYFGLTPENRKFQCSSWGTKTTLKPSELLNHKLKFTNSNGKKLFIEKA